MAKIHGIGDENHIVRPELDLATGASDGPSTSCGNFMQALEIEREQHSQSQIVPGKMVAYHERLPIP
jgi:hypothetical protein